MSQPDDRPPFIDPLTEWVDCYGCGRAIKPESARGLDISREDEYYPRMVPLCPACDNEVSES